LRPFRTWAAFSRTSLQFVPGAKIKDIHGSTPGADNGHRSVGPKPFNARKIKPELLAASVNTYEKRASSPGSRLGHLLHHAVFNQRVQAFGENVRRHTELAAELRESALPRHCLAQDQERPAPAHHARLRAIAQLSFGILSMLQAQP
jgi:hypothetical protein